METAVKTNEEAASVAATPETTNTPTTIVEQETQEQINWKKFRAAREEERKKHVETEKRAQEKEAEATALKAAMEAILNKNPASQSTAPAYQTENVDLSDDERIQQKIEKALADKEKRDLDMRMKQEQAELPQRLASNFKDFDQVCSADNVDYLEYHYPEVAEGFKHMPDGYKKWATIYQAVKKLVPNTDSKKEANKAEKNFNKPQAMSIAGKTQVGDTAPQMLDDKRKADNWKRMQQRMRSGA